ncbi:hypothetical protein K466DRAFT_607736 [Polyporus arcularius HHB13444]|uniref:Uncharacterized protein n=1 Tax=Polyporus arcularius HHB13444 TaxID=1314778 RepID=A0A5C3NJ42_9APHY|nr:hypothetical protein K466DRAFT_607736 [Polyporus arcularius HHB13444]
MSLMDTMEAARVERGPRPTFVRVHTPPSSPNQCHIFAAPLFALRASVSSALSDTAALSVGLVILSPARLIQPSYEPRRAHLRRAHLRRAHRHSRPHTPHTASLRRDAFSGWGRS